MIDSETVGLLKDSAFIKLLEAIQSPDIDIIVYSNVRIKNAATLSPPKADVDRKLLAKLKKLNLIKGVKVGNVIMCPYCGSANVIASYVCPRCSSMDVEKEYFLQHVACGRAFITNTLSVDRCVKCGQPIKSSKDVSLLSGLFKCNSCGNSFEMPNFFYSCSSCRSSFNLLLANVKKVGMLYKLTERGKIVVNLLKAYLALEGELIKRGIKVVRHAVAKGASGVEHVLPLVIEERDKKYAIDLTGLVAKVDEKYVFDVGIKATDLKDISYLMILNESNFNSVGRGLVAYGIETIKVNTGEQVADAIEEKLRGSLVKVM